MFRSVLIYEYLPDAETKQLGEAIVVYSGLLLVKS